MSSRDGTAGVTAETEEEGGGDDQQTSGETAVAIQK